LNLPEPQPFQHQLKAEAADIDQLGHVNNVVYVRWVQEVASAHWFHIAPPEIQEKYLWMVLRHEIDYRHPALPGQEITGLTWVGAHQGARFERFVKLCLAGTDKVLAEAKTTWCLIDAKTMRPKRIDQELLELLPKGSMAG
jgi:acyl-CoA thioester hydrolase